MSFLDRFKKNGTEVTAKVEPKRTLDPMQSVTLKAAKGIMERAIAKGTFNISGDIDVVTMEAWNRINPKLQAETGHSPVELGLIPDDYKKAILELRKKHKVGSEK